MAHFCAPFNITPMRDSKSKNIGVITTAETKENGVLLMQSHLSTGTLRRSNKVFSVGTTAWKSGDASSDGDRFDLRLKELHSQTTRFRKIIKTAADAFGLEKITYSGKDGVHQDDLVMVFIIAVYFIQKALNTA